MLGILALSWISHSQAALQTLKGMVEGVGLSQTGVFQVFLASGKLQSNVFHHNAIISSLNLGQNFFACVFATLNGYLFPLDFIYHYLNNLFDVMCQFAKTPVVRFWIQLASWQHFQGDPIGLLRWTIFDRSPFCRSLRISPAIRRLWLRFRTSSGSWLAFCSVRKLHLDVPSHEPCAVVIVACLENSFWSRVLVGEISSTCLQLDTIWALAWIWFAAAFQCGFIKQLCFGTQDRSLCHCFVRVLSLIGLNTAVRYQWKDALRLQTSMNLPSKRVNASISSICQRFAKRPHCKHCKILQVFSNARKGSSNRITFNSMITASRPPELPLQFWALSHQEPRHVNVDASGNVQEKFLKGQGSWAGSVCFSKLSVNGSSRFSFQLVSAVESQILQVSGWCNYDW